MFYFIRYFALIVIIISGLTNGYIYFQESFPKIPLRIIFPLLIMIPLLFRFKRLKTILRLLSILGILYFLYSEYRHTASISGFYFTKGLMDSLLIEKNTIFFYILISIPIFLYPLLLVSTFTKSAKKIYSK